MATFRLLVKTAVTATNFSWYRYAVYRIVRIVQLDLSSLATSMYRPPLNVSITSRLKTLICYKISLYRECRRIPCFVACGITI